ncbi:MAG: NAD(P)H-hydrate dehydratase [Chloroflexota bacterium]
MAAKILTADQMRTCEERAAALGVPSPVLMENAGTAIAKVVAGLAERRKRGVLVLVGPGNNGGDGLVVARCLAKWDLPVAVYVWHRTKADDRVRELAEAAGVPLVVAEADADRQQLRAEVRRADIVVDALLGTGLKRALSDEIRSLLGVVGEERRQRLVVAVDVPSGLNSDTGEVDEATVAADATVTLGHAKVGHFVSPGIRFTGRLVLADIGLPPGAEVDGVAELLDDEAIANALPARPLYGHKGTFGKAMIVGGSPNYIGAVTLAGEAAYRAGAGLVTLATARGLQPLVAAKITEPTFLPLPESSPGVLGPAALAPLLDGLVGYDGLLVGPGLGRHPDTAAFVRGLVARLAADRHGLRFLAFDADALNVLAGSGDWWRGLGPEAAITPHPGEMSRLLGTSVSEVEANRFAVARESATRWGLVVILKGAYTVVSGADGRLSVSPVATPSLATAGSGDVLAGTLVALGAQGLEAAHCATAAVYLHGRAGELAACRIGEAGVMASDLLPLLPEARRTIVGEREIAPRP